MALIDRLLGRLKRKPQIETDRGADAFGYFEGRNHHWHPGLTPYRQDRIFTVLDSCGIKYDQNNPYEQLRVSRFMYDVFPFAKKAINDIATMVGNIKIGLDEELPDPEMIEKLNSDACHFPILSEFDWLNPHESGFDNYVYRAAFTMLRDGMFFKESRYKNNSLNPKNYLGALIFDSINFHFQKDDSTKPYQLYYKSDQKAEKTGYFEYLGYDFRNTHPWGSPLLAGGSFFVEVLVSAFVAIKNVNLRKANPVEVYGVKINNDDLLKDPTSRKAYLKALGSLESSIVKGAKNQKDGKGGVIVAKPPMGVDLMSKAFGVDALEEIDPKLVELVYMAIANLLEIPMEYLGIVLGAAGFSPERFKIMFRIFGSKIDNIRNKLLPICLFEIQNYYRYLGYDPAIIERIKIEFEDPDIQDDKEKAETSKLEADANAKHMEVISSMNSAGFPMEVMVKYAQDNGLVEEGVNFDMQFMEPIDPFEDAPGQNEPEKELIYS